MADLEEVGVKFVTEGEAAILRAIGDIDGKIDGMMGTIERSGSRISGFQGAMIGAFSAVTSAALEMAARAGEAVAGFVTGSIDEAANFEKGLSMLRATAGATPEELEKVRELSMQLGNDLTLPASSAQDANQAILELVKGGLSLEDAMDAARGTLLLATAAEIDAAEAANITAGAINAFGLEGKDAQRIVDLLAGAAAKGAGEVVDYASGFQQAGFAFKSSGQSATSLATSLQILIERGLTGSDAGTALKNAMIRLQAPTKEASAIMESLGIDVFDSQGNMKRMSEIIYLLNNGMKGMTQEQRNAALSTIFLSDGMKAMIPLLEEGEDAFNERAVAVSEAGSAEALAAAQTEGYNGAVAALENAMSTLQLMIGTALLPVLTDLITNVITPAVTWFMNLVSAVQAGNGSFSDILAVLNSVIPGFDSIIAILVQLRPLFEAQFNAVRQVVEAAMQVVMAVIGEVGKFIDAHADEIAAVFKMAWDTIQMVIAAGVMFYEKVLAPALRDIAKWISDHSDEIQAVFTAVWNVIRTVIQTVLTVIQGIIRAAMQLMQGDTQGALATLQSTFEFVWGTIRNVISDILAAIGQAISDKLTEIRTGVANAFNGIIEWLKGLVKTFFNAGASLIQGLLDGLNSMVGSIMNFFSTLLSNAFNNALAGLPPAVRDALSGLLGLSGARVSPSSTSAASGGGSGTASTTNYNLTLNTSQQSQGVISDYTIMQSLARP